jgi:hypothetical protein
VLGQGRHGGGLHEVGQRVRPLGGRSRLLPDVGQGSGRRLYEGRVRIPYREAKRLVVVGTMACGSCTYKKTASCAPLLKTEDGKVYPLVKNHMIKRMHQAETEQGFELSTRVRKISGVKYLEVLSFRSL